MIGQKTYSVDEALVKLKKYCAYQDRCHQEVHKKLKEMRRIPDAINHIIVILIQENYLNEQRFANAFVSGKFRIKKWGRKRLYLELKKRDISKKTIEKSLLQISEEEYLSTFHDLASKKAESIK